MDKNVLDFIKNSWVVPAIVVMILALVAIKKFNLSVSDYIANKVVKKLEADYSPYGPSAAPQGKD